jgi:hypothetical protein
MQCLECDKPSNTPICCICKKIEKLGEMLNHGCKNADKVQIAYDNACKLRDNRPNH